MTQPETASATSSPILATSRREALALAIAGTAALAASGGKAAAAGASIVAEEHWASKGEVKLYLYRKRAQEAAGRRPVVFLVHGSTFSGRGGFDLQVPGRKDYSLMDRLAGHGYDVWTMDHEGYGRSSRTASHSGIDVGVDDLRAALGVVEAATGARSVMMYGQSAGAIRAGAFAMAEPGRVERLVLDAFTYTGADAPEIARRRKQAETYRAKSHRKVSLESFRRIFTRDDPGTSEPAVAEALAEFELKFGTEVPSGTYLDMATRLPLVHPEKVLCPVGIVRAEHDGNATPEELLEFFRKLPNPDKQFYFLGGMSHVATLGLNRHRLWHVMEAFFGYPSAARS